MFGRTQTWQFHLICQFGSGVALWSSFRLWDSEIFWEYFYSLRRDRYGGETLVSLFFLLYVIG